MCWQLRSTQLMRLITGSTNQAWLEQHGLWPPLGPAARLDAGQETVSHRRTGSQVAPQRFPIQSCRKRLQCSRRTVPCRPPTLNASGKFPAPAAQKWRNKVNEWLTTARRSCFPLGENETIRDHLAVSHHCPALLQVCLASGALNAVQTDARAATSPMHQLMHTRCATVAQCISRPPNFDCENQHRQVPAIAPLKVSLLGLRMIGGLEKWPTSGTISKKLRPLSH